MFNHVGLSVKIDLNIVLVPDSPATGALHWSTWAHFYTFTSRVTMKRRKKQCSVAMNDFLYIEYILSVWTVSMQLVCSVAAGCRYSRGINSALFLSGHTGGMKYLHSA